MSLTKNISGTNNTSVGAWAMKVDSTGSENTAMGAFALSGSDGTGNTAVGSNALSFNETGDNNTAVGYNAGVSNGMPGLANTTAIGSLAVATASNMVRIGNTSVTLIGGQVGWTTLSDVRFKKDIQADVYGLDFILKLQPITYHIDVKNLNKFMYGEKADSLFREQTENMRKKENILYTGFSAQQVEEADSRIGYSFSGIHKPENSHDHYGLDYAQFVVPLVKSVQEQQQLIEQLQKEKESLKKDIQALIIRLEKLESAK